MQATCDTYSCSGNAAYKLVQILQGKRQTTSDGAMLLAGVLCGMCVCIRVEKGPNLPCLLEYCLPVHLSISQRTARDMQR